MGLRSIFQRKAVTAARLAPGPAWKKLPPRLVKAIDGFSGPATAVLDPEDRVAVEQRDHIMEVSHHSTFRDATRFPKHGNRIVRPSRKTRKRCSSGLAPSLAHPGKILSPHLRWFYRAEREGTAVLNLESPSARAVVQAIHVGDPGTLRQLLRANPGMATERFGPADPSGAALTLLHLATDRPGHYPHGAETVAVLVEAGAEVSAPCTGPHAETPLHWAASSNDVDALDALLDAGADIEAPGAVFYGGTPLADAVGFGQWQAARHLIEHGARTTLWQAAALGLRSRIRDCFQDMARPTAEVINSGFWYACRGGQFNAAIFLLNEGADLNWLPEGEKQTPLDAARLADTADLAKWLHTHGAKSAAEVQRPNGPAGVATSTNPFSNDQEQRRHHYFAFH